MSGALVSVQSQGPGSRGKTGLSQGPSLRGRQGCLRV